MYKRRLMALLPAAAGLFLVAILLLALESTVSAEGPPPKPCRFYGEIHIRDNPPAVTDCVYAYVNGDKVADHPVEGGHPFRYVMKVPGIYDGQIITFATTNDLSRVVAGTSVAEVESIG